MPSLDAVRHRISVTDDDLELLRRISAGEDTDAEAERRSVLTEAGLVVGEGLVHPLVLDLARCMMQPFIEFWVEASGVSGLTVSHIVVSGDETVWFTDPWPSTEGGELAYLQDEMPMLPWILARLVGFRRATPPQGAEPVTMRLITMATMLAAFSGDTGTEWETARTIFLGKAEEFLSDLPRRQQDLAAAILATLESSWRVTCAWGPGPEHARGIAAWYCGDGGYWIRTDPPEPLLPEQITEDAMATLTPMTGGEVWEQLVGLLPGKAELKAGVAAAEAALRETTPGAGS